MAHIEYFISNAFQERCSIIWDGKGSCVIFDPGAESEAELAAVTGFISRKGLTPQCILLTHAHFDHIYGMSRLCRKYGIPVYMHEKEMFTLTESNGMLCKRFSLPEPETYPFSEAGDKAEGSAGDMARFVSEGDVIAAGDLRFEVTETPGHTPGGVCYFERGEKILVSGDTLFAGSIGRTDHPGGDYDALMAGIFGKLMILDGDTDVIPGHGPCTTIADERTKNPFLMPFNEPYEEQ